MSVLLEAVRAGQLHRVLALVAELTDAERRTRLVELKELRKELRTEPFGRASRGIRPALHLAGAGCHTGAAAAANWLAASDMRWWQAPPALLVQALEDRGAAWLGDVAHRLARRPASAAVSYELMSGLVRRAGCEVPATDTYVNGWIQHVDRMRGRAPVVERLREEPDLPALVEGLFGLGDLQEVRWLLGDGPDSWPSALAELTREGTLERRTVVDACVARLLRGGGPNDHRVFLPMLVRLELTRAEERDRVADWTALARDAASPVASHAQSVLGSLALEGALPHRRLAEASEGILFRDEKKLVRAQLVLLGRVLSREPAAVPELLPAVAQAFGHEDIQIQERALKLVERHARKAAPAAALSELAPAATLLSPALRVRAERVLGVTPPQAPPAAYEEVLPPVPQPVRLAGAPATAVELAEEVGALLASGGGVAEFERVLDGLVRHAHHDRAALLDALEPVFVRRWWDTAGPAHRGHAEPYFVHLHHGLGGPQEAVDLLLATLRGAVRTDALHAGTQDRTPVTACAHQGVSRAFDARIREVAYRLRTDPLPLLLSTPTWSTGLLEPDELVARLDTCRRLGARVSENDFAQALLRVRRGDRSEAAAAAGRAEALRTREGERLARWLRAGPPSLPTVRRRTSEPRILVDIGEVREFQAELPAVFRRAGRPVAALGPRRSYCFHGDPDLPRHWASLLPELPELVAVRLVQDLSDAAVDDGRGAGAVLPVLAESAGETGECVHLCLAYGLAARHPQDRLAAVDALLVLAARGRLDAARLGTDLGQLIRLGAVKPLRLAESARTAAATGAAATTWSVLRHTLPILLADHATTAPAEATAATGTEVTAGTPVEAGATVTAGAGGPAGPPLSVRGLGDLLAVAAECVERCGDGGELPYLTGPAGRRGSSRLVAQARRLRDALAAGGKLAA